MGRHSLVRHQRIKRREHQERGARAGGAHPGRSAYRRRDLQRRHSRAAVQALPAMAGGAGGARASLDEPRKRGLAARTFDRTLARRAAAAFGSRGNRSAGRDPVAKQHQARVRDGWHESRGDRRKPRRHRDRTRPFPTRVELRGAQKHARQQAGEHEARTAGARALAKSKVDGLPTAMEGAWAS